MSEFDDLMYETEIEEKPTLDEALDALKADASNTLPGRTLVYGLSDLPESATEKYRQVWQELPAGYRAKLVRFLAETSEINWELRYDVVGQVALDDVDPRVRSAAIDVLWENESIEHMDRLIHLAQKDENEGVRIAAVKQLETFIYKGEVEELPASETTRAEALMLAILDDESESVELRRRALEAIANCSQDRVTNEIQQAYSSDDSRLQVSAVYAMGKTCDNRWDDIVIRELQSGQSEMQYEAARAAGELAISSAVRHLHELAQEDDVEIRSVVFWALGEIGTEEAIRLLNAYSQDLTESGEEELLEIVEDALATANFMKSDMFLFGSEYIEGNSN